MNNHISVKDEGKLLVCIKPFFVDSHIEHHLRIIKTTQSSNKSLKIEPQRPLSPSKIFGALGGQLLAVCKIALKPGPALKSLSHCAEDRYYIRLS